MEENVITGEIIGAAIEVHKVLGGPGLLEQVYEEALCHELKLKGLNLQRQVQVPVIYKGVEIKKALFLDIMVDERIIVEVKATEKHNLIFEAQLLTYLRLTDLRLGLVINFGARKITDGINRVVNKL